MSLTSRKLIALSLIAGVFLAGNILFIAQWLADKGIPETAHWIRQEFLTGTAIAVIVTLLILLVSPGEKRKASIWAKTCPVCDAKTKTADPYCSACGSKVKLAYWLVLTWTSL